VPALAGRLYRLSHGVPHTMAAHIQAILLDNFAAGFSIKCCLCVV